MKAPVALATALTLWATGTTHSQVAPAKEQKDLAVIGHDGKTTRMTVAELDKLPQEEVAVTNEDGSKTTYTGVKLRAILDTVAVPSDRALRGDALQQFVVVAARDGYSVPFTVAELDPAFGNLKAILAYRKDGGALFQYEGPFRLLCPTDKAGARSVRMVQSIRILTLPPFKEGS